MASDTEAAGPVQAPNGVVRVVATYDGVPPGRLRLPFITEPYVDMAASFRSLRHRMQTLTNARMVAVTSPQPEEGKTTCAINLAMAFAEHGVDNVLLLEANLQNPSLAAGLGFTPPTCFARQMKSALKDEASYEWQAVAAYYPNLHVLAVDPTEHQPSYLHSFAFTNAMRQIKSAQYAYIIVDCPQVFGSADISIVQDFVDGVLFAAHAGVTKGSELRKAVQLMEPVNVLGTVLMRR